MFIVTVFVISICFFGAVAFIGGMREQAKRNATKLPAWRVLVKKGDVTYGYHVLAWSKTDAEDQLKRGTYKRDSGRGNLANALNDGSAKIIQITSA